MDPLNQTPNHQAPKDFWEDPEIRNFLTRLEYQVTSVKRFNTELSGSYSLLLPTITKITVNLRRLPLTEESEGIRPKAVLTMSTASDQSRKVQGCAENFLTGMGFDVIRKSSFEGQ